MFSKSLTKKLETFLNAHRTEKGSNDYTHICLGGLTLPGKFTITENDDKKLLHKLIKQSIKNKEYISIAEKQKEYGPLIVDLDFKQEIKENINRLYDNELINKINKLFREEVKKICEINDDAQLECVIFEKSDKVIKENEYKDGVHLMYPNLCLHTSIKKIITNEVIKTCEDLDLFKNYSNSDVIDDISIVPWLMYGCCKPNQEPYLISKYVDENDEIVYVEEFQKNSYLIKYLSLQNKKWGKNKSTKLITDIKKEEEIFTELGSGNAITQKDINEDEIKKIQKIVDMFSLKRSDNYHTWLQVGWALHSINECLLNIWIKFSKKSNKFKNGECKEKWEKMKMVNKGFTIGSLMYWANEDNPVEYEKFKKNNEKFYEKVNDEYIIKFFEELDLSSNTFFAEKFIEFFNEDKYIYCDKLKSWFEYNDNNILVDYGIVPPLSLSNNITKICQKKLKEVFNNVEPNSKEFDNYCKIYKRNYKSLGATTFKSDIIKELRFYYNDNELVTKLDNNDNIVAFTDKLFDFSIGEYRNIEKSDFVSITTGYKAPIKSNKIINDEIMNVFKSIFNTNELITFVFETLGYSLFTNEFEKLYIWSGSGGNGKGLLMTIIQNAFGEYFNIPDNQFLTTRYKSGAANSSLYNTKNKKIVMISEPEGDDKGELQFNLEFVKKLTGRDLITTRTLYKENETFKPKFNLFVQCNDKPTFDRVDNAVRRRFIDINFPNQFVDEPKYDHQRKIDYTLKSKFESEDYYKEFMYILINHIKDHFKERKLNIPFVVKESTSEYIQENNVVGKFIEDCLEITNNKKDIIPVKELYELYIQKGYHKTTRLLFKSNMISNNIRAKKTRTTTEFFGIKKISNKVVYDSDSDDGYNSRCTNISV